MNALQAAHALMGMAVLDDPRLALANAVAWLDPALLLGVPDDSFDEMDNLAFALHVCRSVFPDVYTSVAQLLWQGADESLLSAHICTQINARIVPHLEHIEQMRGGIPLDGLGIDWANDETPQLDGLTALMAEFEVEPGDDGPSMELACAAARLLVMSLGDTKRTYREIGNCLLWLFSISGNTLVDLSNEELWESGLELPDWTLDDLEFCNEMIREAQTIVAEALRGLEILQTDKALRVALRRNIRRAYAYLHTKKETLTMSSAASVLNGLNALSTVMTADPKLVISIYDYGILMRRTAEDGSTTEYPISPAQLATALSAKMQFSTGLLTGSTVAISAEGLNRVVIEYRVPQKTALFLEGSDTPVYAPLPGLLLVRATTGNDNPRYGIYAIKQRPMTPDAALFACPLPNTSTTGICWGSVKKPSATSLAGNTLDEDWILLLGSVFTSHSVNGKSKSHPQDIRQKLLDLEQRKARVYPTRDLIPLHLNLSDVLGKALKG